MYSNELNYSSAMDPIAFSNFFQFNDLSDFDNIKNNHS